jgi:hypothetical protein
MNRDNDLTAIGMAPFLVTSFLANLRESVFAQYANDLFRCANWESFAHASATSNTFALGDKLTGRGSNHSSKASFALRTASSSESPAEAQPGSSGKNAAQRFASRSNSTTRRNFMSELYPMFAPRQIFNTVCYTRSRFASWLVNDRQTDEASGRDQAINRPCFCL